MTNKLDKKKGRKSFVNNEFETPSKKKKVEETMDTSDMCSVEKLKNKKSKEIKKVSPSSPKKGKNNENMGEKNNKKSKIEKKPKILSESPSTNSISEQLNKNQKKRLRAKILKQKYLEKNPMESPSVKKPQIQEGNSDKTLKNKARRLKKIEKLKKSNVTLSEIEDKLSSANLSKAQKQRLKRLKSAILHSGNVTDTNGMKNPEVKVNSKEAKIKKNLKLKKKPAQENSSESDYKVEDEVEVEKESDDDENESDDVENDDEDKSDENENDEEDESGEENENDEEDESNEGGESDETEDKTGAAKDANKKLDGKVKGQSRYVLFVGNLPYTVGDEEIKDHFAKTCEVLSVRLQKNKEDNKPRGFAYVELKNENSFQKALSLHHSFLGGRRINVLYTKPGTKNSPQQKNDLKKKNLKLKAMREKGTFGSPQKNLNKRNDRRKKQFNVNNNE